MKWTVKRWQNSRLNPRKRWSCSRSASRSFPITRSFSMWSYISLIPAARYLKMICVEKISKRFQMLRHRTGTSTNTISLLGEFGGGGGGVGGLSFIRFDRPDIVERFHGFNLSQSLVLWIFRKNYKMLRMQNKWTNSYARSYT